MATKLDSRTVRVGSGLAALILGAGLLAAPAGAQGEPAQFFQQNCASCHSIGGGRLVGPDLRHVTQRKDRAWLIRFITDPPAMLASGDAYAAQLLKEANNVPMTKVAGVDAAVAGQLLDYIEAQSAAPPAAEAAPLVLTPEDAAAGRNLYLGYQALQNQGPACITCHQVAGLPAPGGGVLGPDLTQTFARLGGARGLSAWLASPASLTMQPIFRGRPLAPAEITALTAWFQELSQQQGATASAATIANTVTFLLLGILGTLVFLGLLDWIWRRRFTAVREPLVRGESQ